MNSAPGRIGRPFRRGCQGLAYHIPESRVNNIRAILGAAVAFDAEPGLHRVRAPTLVVGGSADAYYAEELFRLTAAGIPGGRAVIFPGKGHLYASTSPAAASIALDFLLGG